VAVEIIVDEWEIATAARMLTQLLPHQDLTLIILQGHLLIEEQLLAAVYESVPFPNPIREGRLRYRDLSAIAKALFYRSDEQWLW
jgi:hypothetical protein